MVGKHIPVGIDFSHLVHFNSARIQTAYVSYCVGYLQAELSNVERNNTHILFPKLVTPKQIRQSAGLSVKTKKQEVQDWYLTNTNLMSYDFDSWSEDAIDAAILAYYVR